ncbi:LCP family protein [Nocardioides sp.]|uniref:LCP family protein n=1 Tax=Nocardioides sp. TaxID=35761 RepID=UPI0039E2EAE3
MTAPLLDDDCSLTDLLDDDDLPPAGPPRRRLRRVVVVMVTLLALLAGIPVAVAWYVEHRLSSQLTRMSGIFAALPESQRPAKPAAGAPGAAAVDILLIGTDRRSEVATTGTDAAAADWVPGQQRSDTLMLLHIDGDRRSAAVVSIPRDSWVDIPGHGKGKINAAFSYGGPSLAVATVEQLTGIRIDHVAIVDWTGFEELTDAVGGVDIDIPETVHDSANDVTWEEGRHHLDGEQALLYVRQRYGLPGGDFDRVKRQQAFLRSVMEASLHQEMRKDPRLLYDFLSTLARHVTVDAEWSTTQMAKLAFSLRDFRSANVEFLTAPSTGTGMVGDQSVVFLDQDAGRELWHELRTDRIDEWSSIHWRELTGDVVR